MAGKSIILFGILLLIFTGCLTNNKSKLEKKVTLKIKLITEKEKIMVKKENIQIRAQITDSDERLVEGENLEFYVNGIKKSSTTDGVFSFSTTETGKHIVTAKIFDSRSSPLIIEGYLPEVKAPLINFESKITKEGKRIELSSDITGASIYYTIDGSDPDKTRAILYKEPIYIQVSTLIKAIAYIEDDIKSNISMAKIEFQKKLAAPKFALVAENITLVSEVKPGIIVKYTTDGSIPNATNGLKYVKPFFVEDDTLIKAVSVFETEESEVYTELFNIDIVRPLFDAKINGDEQIVTITKNTDEGVIRYTTDGTPPTKDSPIYQGTPIVFSKKSKIIITAKVFVESDNIRSLPNEYNSEYVPTPVFSLKAGKYTKKQFVSITSPLEGSEIKYTLDGSEPTTDSAIYKNPIEIKEASEVVLKAKAYKSGYNDSSVNTAVYLVTGKSAKPEFFPEPGRYAGNILIEIKSSDNSNIRYTLNGKEPDENSALYIGPLKLDVNSGMTLMAKTFKENWEAGETVSGIYSTFSDSKNGKIEFDREGGVYIKSFNLKLKWQKDEGTPLYTTDNSEPVSGSKLYVDGIDIKEDTILKARLLFKDGTLGEIYTMKYFISDIKKSLFVKPAGGIYSTAQSIGISSNVSGKILYTLNGTDFEAGNGIEFKGEIVIKSDTILKFKLITANGETSEILTEKYIITGKVTDIITPTLKEGKYTTSQSLKLLGLKEGLKVYYAFDNEELSDKTSRLFTSNQSISIEKSTLLKVRAYRDNWEPGDIQSFTYIIKDKVNPPEISLKSGTYDEGTAVKIESTTGSTIYYTIDGTIPDEKSFVYKGIITLDKSIKIRAIAKKEQMDDSDISEAVFIIKVNKPTFSTTSGQISKNTKLELKTSTTDSSIYYIENNGKEMLYKLPIEITTPTAIKAYASKEGLENSEEVSAVYTITERLESIAIKTPAIKTNYYPGEKLDISGLTVEGIYSSGIKRIEIITTENIIGFENTTLGIKTLIIIVGTEKTAYQITVIPYFTVSFDSNGGNSVDSVTKLTYNSIISAPGVPTKYGNKFVGWYKEKSVTNIWNFETDKITADTILYAKWAPIVFSVTFNSNGGNSISAVNNIGFNSTINAPAAPTKTGNTFAGWYKDETLADKWNFESDKVTAETVLYAKWAPVVFTVTFNSNGGTTLSAITNIGFNSMIKAPSAPTKAGNTFADWYKDEALANKWNFESDKVTADTVLYAKWVPVVFTVTFNSNGGTTLSAITNIGFNSIIVAPSAPTKTGNTFADWYKDEALANKWNFESDKVTADTVLFAKWAPVVLMVTFNSNGGTAVSAINNIGFNSTITAPAAPTKTGNTFAGWYKDETFSSNWNFESDKVTADTVLFAKWSPVVLTVTFNSNGGTAVSAITNVGFNSTITAPSAPTKIETNFAGWYKDAALADKWNFEVDRVTSDAVLYAKWSPVIFTVFFNSNSEINIPAIYNIGFNSTITAPALPAKYGYIFAGWYKDETFTNKWSFETDKVNSDMILFGKWVPIISTVTFNSNGGSAISAISNIAFNSTIAAPSLPTKFGNTFDGWYKDEALANKWSFETERVTSDITLYAKWTPIILTATFNSNGSTAISAINNIGFNSLITAPSAITKAGNTFDGWYKEESLTNKWIFETDKVTYDIILYAKWSPIISRVTFDSNGGSSVDAISNVAYEAIINAPLAPAKYGHTFAGWYKDPGYMSLWAFNSDKVTANITLFAKWYPIISMVTFDSNGGSGVDTIKNVAYESTINTPLAPAKYGHTFAGWYKDPGYMSLWAFNTDKVTSNITLFAKWSPIISSVTFDSNGGSGVDAISNVAYESTINAPSAPSKAGNTFDGWYRDSGCTSIWNFNTDKVTANITLFAKWSVIFVPSVFTVSFNSNGGSAVSAIGSVTNNTTISAPASPTKAGYAFGGWYKEVGLTNGWTFGTDTVTGDITLYAKWLSSDATLSAGTFGTVALVGTFTGRADIANSQPLTVTIPFAKRTDPSLSFTKGNADSTIKYVRGSQPANDNGYTGTFTEPQTVTGTFITNNIIWLLVTAQDGTTKRYYKITVTVSAASTDATLSAGTLAEVGLAGNFAGGSTIGASTGLTVTISDDDKTAPYLSLTKGNANSTIKYVKKATTPLASAYTETFTEPQAMPTLANNDIIWLLVTAENVAIKKYYKITVTLQPSTNATISGGTLATLVLTGTFTGGADIANSQPLTVTIPDESKTNAALELTKGNSNSIIKYVKGAEPTGDGDYANTYTAGTTQITVANTDVIWLLVTAQDTTTKKYYKITVTVPANSASDATILAGKLGTVWLAGTFTGGADIASSQPLTVSIANSSKTDPSLLLIKGTSTSTVKYVTGGQPGDDAGYTQTFTSPQTITGMFATNDVIWLLVTSQDTTSKLYYKITVTVLPPSSDATITAGTWGGVRLSGDFAGGLSMATSKGLKPVSSITSSAVFFTKGDVNSTIKYVLTNGQPPANEALYTNTYTPGVVLSNAAAAWYILVTAEDGTTKRYYSLYVTVPIPPNK